MKEFVETKHPCIHFNTIFKEIQETYIILKHYF